MKANINICILLTLLIIIILILYFYLNQYQKEVNKLNQEKEQNKDITEHFIDSNKLTKYVILVHMGGIWSDNNYQNFYKQDTQKKWNDVNQSYINLSLVRLNDQSGRQLRENEMSVQANSQWSPNDSTYSVKNLISDSWNEKTWEKVLPHADLSKQSNKPITPDFTHFGNKPLFLITLNNPTEILQIRILNRQGCCQFRAENIKVLLYNSDLSEIFSHTISRNSGYTTNEESFFAHREITNASLLWYNIPTSTPLSQIKKNWTDQGCWWDLAKGHTSERVIKLIETNNDAFTHKNLGEEACFREAERNGANIVGLQAGWACFYGNTNVPPNNLKLPNRDPYYKKFGYYDKKDGANNLNDNSLPICHAMGDGWINRVWTKTIDYEQNWDNQGCWFDLNNSDVNLRAINGGKVDISLGNKTDKEKKNECLEIAEKNGANVAGMQNGNQCFYENNNYNSYKQYGKVPDSQGCATYGGTYINNVWTKKSRVEIPDFDPSQPIEIKRIVIERQGWKSGDVLSQFINISKIYLYDENKNKIVSGLTANGNLAYTTGDQQPSNLVNYTNNGDTSFALNYHTNTTTSIISDSKPYINFDVKLASPQKLTQIDIKNRTDCCQDRILGLVLKAYNVRGIEIFRYYFNEVKNYYQIPVNIDLPQNTTISLPFSKLTKYVKLEKINYNPYVPDTQLMKVSKIKLFDENSAVISSGLSADLNPIFSDSSSTYGPNNLINYSSDPNNSQFAYTTQPSTDTSVVNQRINNNTPTPFMKVELNTPRRLSKITIINKKEEVNPSTNQTINEWYRMIGVRLSGFDENNNVLYTYDCTRALSEYTIKFNIEAEYNKNNNDATLVNKSGLDYTIPYVVKTIKIQKLNNLPIGLSKIYIYDDKSQLIRNNLSLSINPQNSNQKFDVNNLIKYEDDLQNITSLTKSAEGAGNVNAIIQITLNKEQAISKIILLNYTENGILSNLINNSRLSLLGTSNNELFSFQISNTLTKYEIDTKILSAPTANQP